jgi:hypothetical protein
MLFISIRVFRDTISDLDGLNYVKTIMVMGSCIIGFPTEDGEKRLREIESALAQSLVERGVGEQLKFIIINSTSDDRRVVERSFDLCMLVILYIVTSGAAVHTCFSY